MLEMMVVLPVDHEADAEQLEQRFNRLNVELQCSECWGISHQQVVFALGVRRREVFRLGDTLEWAENRSLLGGGRPANGACVVEGRAECRGCGAALSVSLHVSGDRLQRARALGLFGQTGCFQ